MKKRKGHYCRVCGKYKYDNDFCGSTGYSYHICQECKSEPFKLENMSILSFLIDMKSSRHILDYSECLHGYTAIYPKKIFKTLKPFYGLYPCEINAAKQLWEQMVKSFWEKFGIFPTRDDIPYLIQQWKMVINRDLGCRLREGPGFKNQLYAWMSNVKDVIISQSNQSEN